MGKLKKLKKFVPPHDPLWTDGRASTEQALGIERTSLGHTLPMRRATNAQLLDLFWALLFLFPTSIPRKHNEECLHQLLQMGKLKKLKKFEKLKPYALQIDIQPKRLLAITSNDQRE